MPEGTDNIGASRRTQIQRARRNVVCVAIVLAGLVAALAIFVATPPSASPLAERPEDSKQYLREMEIYGGKANVLASRFREWFGGLWHGRSLAFTVLGLALLLALLVFALSSLPPAVDPEALARAEGDGRRAGGTGGRLGS